MKVRSRAQLIEHINSGNTVDYIFFWGHRQSKEVTKSCFSQWYESPFDVDGQEFKTAEHFMMHRKARLFGDQASAVKAIAADTPKDAKAVGRSVQGFDQAIWECSRFDIVVEANIAKFSQHPGMLEYLISTGESVLVEASPYDKIWGIGLAADSPRCQSPSEWDGDNLLGFALMEVRESLL